MQKDHQIPSLSDAGRSAGNKLMNSEHLKWLSNYTVRRCGRNQVHLQIFENPPEPCTAENCVSPFTFKQARRIQSRTERTVLELKSLGSYCPVVSLHIIDFLKVILWSKTIVLDQDSKYLCFLLGKGGRNKNRHISFLTVHTSTYTSLDIN